MELSTRRGFARSMADFDDARDALQRAVRKVFPDAKPVPRWAGVEAWGAPRPAALVQPDTKGTYDPALTVIGIADRKSGPTIYFLDPGDYFVLDTHRALLEDAGFKLGRGCIMHTRKGALPIAPLVELFRIVKARDAGAAARGAKAASATKPRAAKPSKAPAKAAGRAMGSPKSVEAYLAALPAPHRAALEKLRGQIRAAAPMATEKISYGIPTFFHEGNLVHMAAFKDHCSFFPGSDGVTLLLREKLAGFEVAKGTIRFTPEKPLPAALVRKIVNLRVAANEKRAAAKTTRRANPAARRKR